MKRYSISFMREVNRQASKTGLSFHYEGRTDHPEEVIQRFEETQLTEHKYSDHWIVYYHIGLKVTDSTTKEVIYCHQRVQDASELPAMATIHM